MTEDAAPLFTPVTVGDLTLPNRIAMAGKALVLYPDSDNVDSSLRTVTRIIAKSNGPQVVAEPIPMDLEADRGDYAAASGDPLLTDDGDPLDILVLCEEPVYPLTLVKTRAKLSHRRSQLPRALH